MSEYAVVRRLRPHLFCSFKRYFAPCQSRAFATQRPQPVKSKGKGGVTHDYEKRVEQLKLIGPPSTWYPRLSPGFAKSRTSLYRVQKKHGHLLPNQTDVDVPITVTGKVRSLRAVGGKLAFMDLDDGSDRMQIVCSFDKLSQAQHPVALPQFKEFVKVARKGDAFAVHGNPHRTQAGELSVQATSLPTLLSPALHQIPEKLENAEFRARNRHVDMLVNEEGKAAMLVRHHVEATLQSFFNERGFTKVTTPILNSIAGGAAARPFETEATELIGETLHLRIAPELWLKRLVVGGLERVYEIGPAFRNEGVDLTHNPEFSICEFYEAYATLDDLMQRTRLLFQALANTFQQLKDSQPALVLPDPDPRITQPFATVEFIPKLEELLGVQLPNLEDDDNAADRISDILTQHDIPLPANPSLPRLLDALAAAMLEPLSDARPTFILHHPACMSPLSKHFTCAQSGQRVAARAELFLARREYANMYEEENSPFAQRANFAAQRRASRETPDPEAMPTDERYLQALEWGLPPTGGWGCGVDRLVMLFAGRDRMADVLAFGSLRNVVGLGKS